MATWRSYHGPRGPRQWGVLRYSLTTRLMSLIARLAGR